MNTIDQLQSVFTITLVPLTTIRSIWQITGHQSPTLSPHWSVWDQVTSTYTSIGPLGKQCVVVIIINKA